MVGFIGAQLKGGGDKRNIESPRILSSREIHYYDHGASSDVNSAIGSKRNTRENNAKKS